MARIELKGLGHQYTSKVKRKKEKGPAEEKVFKIEDLNLVWKDGSANALLGPSGCGKTTLLNVISGLLVPQEGTVLFNGEDVTRMTARERHISQVFQFPVVYESLSVFGNIAYPLKNDGLDSTSIKKRVHEIAELLELTEVLNKSTEILTAADKQKVSLGRGLVRKDTAAVLLDEPLTVIDPKQQWSLRRKLKQAQEELNLTMIYVTHDQHEALTFAENVTIMSNGKAVQSGTPETLHEEPASPFVGYFIGSPGMNLFDTKKSGSYMKTNDFSLEFSDPVGKKIQAVGSDFTLGIRPEYIVVSKDEPANGIQTRVVTVEDTGAYKILTLKRGDTLIKTRAPETMRLNVGDDIWASFPEERICIFKKD